MKKNSKYILCPIRDVIAHLNDKWSLLIIVTLSRKGIMRFNEIHKEIEDISQRMLTVTLRALESDGLLSRKIYPEVPPRVEYQLTELGHSLLPPLTGLVDWALDNMDAIHNNRKQYKDR